MRDMLAGQEKTVEKIRAVCEVLSRFYERKMLSNTEKWICAQPSNRKSGVAFNAVNFVPVCDNCGTKLGKSEGECPGPKKCKFKEFDAARVKQNMEARLNRLDGANSDKSRKGKGKGNGKSDGGTQQKPVAKWKPAVNGSTPGFKPQSSGPPETREAYYSDGNPFTYCKICKWNQTHPTKYHREYLAKGDQFDMCVAAPAHPFTHALNLIQANGDDSRSRSNGTSLTSLGTRTCSQTDFLSTLNMMKENAQDRDHLRTLTDIEATLEPLFRVN